MSISLKSLGTHGASWSLQQALGWRGGHVMFVSHFRDSQISPSIATEHSKWEKNQKLKCLDSFFLYQPQLKSGHLASELELSLLQLATPTIAKLWRNSISKYDPVILSSTSLSGWDKIHFWHLSYNILIMLDSYWPQSNSNGLSYF